MKHYHSAFLLFFAGYNDLVEKKNVIKNNRTYIHDTRAMNPSYLHLRIFSQFFVFKNKRDKEQPHVHDTRVKNPSYLHLRIFF